ncbi:terminase large subunit [Comamonas sp. C11]|uniref:terminase large subunit n=1 Tax=Comamonas sp. C11 TaxID=2966554 RepID=UPI002110E9F0|nr:terminase large subunit [Comamonas sp. C11]UUC92471.1 terminase large subunit [Comamonas sp. C11]UUC92523.1 terminase large subunit [Comamonas sp. C11]
MEWSTACIDWEERLVKRKSIIPPPIFQDRAEQALAIFKELKVVDLPKVWDAELDEYRPPTFGECSEEWVFDFVRVIFGAYDAETGKQLIREYGLLISKKNTKSTIAAGIMLTALILCWREDEEHLILAPTKEVADNSFKPAASMVRADEELSALFHIQDHIRTITHRVNRNSLKVVAADTDTVSGKKSGKILVDELWLFGKRANADAMFQEALGGQVSREEGWVIFLTTQSDEAPEGVFKAKLDYWRDVRDGKVVSLKTLGILYEFPEAMIKSKAYLDPENFYITNPNLGRSVSKEWLTDEMQKRSPEQDGGFQRFLAKHLNIQIGLNLRANRWTGADFWEKRGDKRISLDFIRAECEVVTVGIDGGGLDDLLGFAIDGRLRDTQNCALWNKAWIHPIAIERRKSEEAKYRDFEKDGDLVVVERPGQDLEELAALCKQIFDWGLLARIGLDPERTHKVVFQALIDAGIPEDLIIGISQGWKLTGAMAVAERGLLDGSLVHAAQPLMAWSVGNAKVVPSGNASLITKQASGTAKIDPLMASLNAVTLMATNPEAKGPSVYETRGMRFL